MSPDLEVAAGALRACSSALADTAARLSAGAARPPVPPLVPRWATTDAAALAARFAAKEAVAQALGAPAGLRWHDCEIVSDPDGRPWLTVSGTVAAVAGERGISRWHLSLSHDGGIASAMVVAET